MKVYLAGPMRGIPRFNFPAFDYAASVLRAEGHEVFSPAEHDRVVYGLEVENNPTGDESKGPPGLTIRKCLCADTAWICEHAEEVALLPGWEDSKGARAEKALAEALGLDVSFLSGKYVRPRDHISFAPPPPPPPFVPSAPGPRHCIETNVISLPRRALPDDSSKRKTYPMGTGLVDYFPDALAVVANVSYQGNEKHNPGESVHWARGKSMDHADCIMRHFVERGGRDNNGVRHSAQMAWRSLALLQEELEKELGLGCPRGATELPQR